VESITTAAVAIKIVAFKIKKEGREEERESIIPNNSKKKKTKKKTIPS
jgi:hypothetical protein